MVIGTQIVLPLGKKYCFPPDPSIASSRHSRNDHTEALIRRTSEKKERRMGSWTMAFASKAFEVIFLEMGSMRYSATRSRMSLTYSGFEAAMTAIQKPVGRVLAPKTKISCSIPLAKATVVGSY